MITAEVKSKEEFEEVISSNDCIIVDYFATWCGPCRQMAPLLEDIDGEVVKVDVDENPELAQEHGVMGLPTLALFQDGEEVKRVTGAQQKTDIESLYQSC